MSIAATILAAALATAPADPVTKLARDVCRGEQPGSLLIRTVCVERASAEFRRQIAARKAAYFAVMRREHGHRALRLEKEAGK